MNAELKIEKRISLELGGELENPTIAYTTFGSLNQAKDNVIWVFHALTANQNPLEWWPGLCGENCFFDPIKDFIVCANVLGSCYGTTGPKVSKFDGAHSFPKVSVRDITTLNLELAKYLGISKVKYAVGGSFGGSQAIEFSLIFNVENLIVIAANSQESPWNIAIHEAQRMAINADPTINETGGGTKGLEAARAIGLLTYRTAKSMNESQPRKTNETENFSISSYLNYQGKKLSNRFVVRSYLTLLDCLDTHDISRGRGSIEDTLKQIKAKTLFIGIEEDRLACALRLQNDSEHLVNGKFQMLNSKYGHDGFLIETEKITNILQNYF